MVRMDKLLEAWRSDPRVEPTVELCSMFARASQKPVARDAIPRQLLIGFANDALGRHLDNLDVLVAVCDMYLSAGEVELAADVADRASRAHPDEDRTRVLVARVSLLRGKQTRELVSGESSDDEGPASRDEQTGGGSEGVTLDAPTTPLEDAGDPPTEPQTRKNDSMVALLGEKARGRTPLATPDPPPAGQALLRNPTQVGMGLAPPPPMQRKRTLQGGLSDADRGLGLQPPEKRDEAEKRDEDDVPTRTETNVSAQRQAPDAPAAAPSRKETRRAAVREKRGVGADDPLMKAAIARRNQLAQDGEGQKTRPDRDNQPTRDFSSTAPPPLEDDDGTAPTRARPVLPPPARPRGVAAAYAPTLLGTTTLEPEEPSTDVQDPITGMSHVVTNVWDRSRGMPSATSEEQPTAQAKAPPRPTSQSPAPPQAQMAKLEPDEDAIETNLRTLPDHLRQMARAAVGQPDPEEVIETNLREVPARLREVARRSVAEPDDDDGPPRTYIMKPEERAAAANVDPRPPTRSSMPPATHVMNAEPPLRMKPAGLPSFGPPPSSADPLALSGQGPIASMPPSSADPMQRSMTHMTPSFTPAPLAISSPPGAPNPYETGARPYDVAYPPEAPRRSTGLYVALGIAIVMVGILVSYAGYLVISDYGKPKTADASDRAAQAEEKVLAGSPRDLIDATVLLASGERTLSKEEAEVLVRAEMLETLDVTGKEGGLRKAIALESQAQGAPSAAAELVLAMVDGSTSDVERALEKVRAAPDDPFAALVEGALLEKRGSSEASQKYEKALALEPKLTSARVRLAHLLLVEGKIKEAEAQIRFLDEKAPARAVLTALVWASSKVYGGEPRTRPERLPTSAEVPRLLHGVYAALSVLDAGAGSDASGLCARAIAESEVPGVALFFGRLALTRNDRITAIRAARRALDLSPGLRAAVDLAGKSALELGKLGEIDDIVSKGPADVTRHLAALKAYEAFDVDALRDMAAITTGDETDKIVIKAQLARLKGKPLVETELQQLTDSKVTGADLVLVDLLLDAGNLDRAGKIVEGWGDTSSAASRARRGARLLRYRGDLDEAGLALANADQGQATLIERVLLDAEIPRQRDRAIEALLRRPSPLEGTQVRKYLEAYVRARTDETARAEDLIKEIDPPTSSANFPSRVCAALAFAETKDKRGEALVRSLFEIYPANRDVLRAAAGFGMAEMPDGSH